MNSELSSPGIEPAVIPAVGKDFISSSEEKTGLSKATEGFRLKIPPILLEGDDAPESEAQSPKSKSAESTPEGFGHGTLEVGLPVLPKSYGTQKLLLTARDPHWLYAHWDLTDEQQREHCEQAEQGRLTLRVHRQNGADHPVAEVNVHPDARHWFVHVEKAAANYHAELGYKSKYNGWTPISSSAQTTTPPDAVSTNDTATFATVPIQKPMAELMSLAKSNAPDLPLAEALEKLRASRHPALPPVQPLGNWSQEQASAIAEIMRRQSLNFVPGSFDLASSGFNEVSSQGLTQFSAPTSPGISSPMETPPAPQNFWFKINAELMIYGSTEPNAKVTISGREIKLNADGSFNFRFSLPDGEFELPVVAVSADQNDTRVAELKFTRSTNLRGEIHAHPQDANLKAPAGGKPRTHVSQDEEHLRLLSIFHFVCAGLAALVACFPLIHLAIGLFMVLSPQSFGPAKNQPPAFIGWFFIILASTFILCGWTFAALLAWTGRCLRKRNHYTFCLVMAAVACLFMPFGTVLGVFTIIALMRPSVKTLFANTSSVGPVI